MQTVGVAEETAVRDLWSDLDRQPRTRGQISQTVCAWWERGTRTQHKCQRQAALPGVNQDVDLTDQDFRVERHNVDRHVGHVVVDDPGAVGPVGRLTACVRASVCVCVCACVRACVRGLTE